MKQKLKQCWQAFLGWKLWKAVGDGCVKAWQATIRWRGWQKLFGLPMAMLLLLSAVCIAGLVFVFIRDITQHVIAYILYPFSAYTLVALCIRLGKALQQRPKAPVQPENKERAFSRKLYAGQLINFTYGSFKIVSGVVTGSAWIGSDGIYNMAQALIQLFQILRRKKPGELTAQWKSYRTCGVLILLMHLTLTGIVFQMVNWNRAKDQGQIMVIATATFTFYKLITSFINIAKDRKHTHPVDSSVRMLKLSQAIFAIFSLQASLLHAYGTGESWEHLLNTVTGCAMCFLVAAMGVYMIRRANRQLKIIQEEQHGQ